MLVFQLIYSRILGDMNEEYLFLNFYQIFTFLEVMVKALISFSEMIYSYPFYLI
jgi:hypothetical protein